MRIPREPTQPGYLYPLRSSWRSRREIPQFSSQVDSVNAEAADANALSQLFQSLTGNEEGIGSPVLGLVARKDFAELAATHLPPIRTGRWVSLEVLMIGLTLDDRVGKCADSRDADIDDITSVECEIAIWNNAGAGEKKRTVRHVVIPHQPLDQILKLASHL